MKNIFFLFLLFFFVINVSRSQDNNDLRWNQIPSTSPAIDPVGTYTELPQYDLNYSAPTEPRKIASQNTVYSVSPNFRVHPRTNGTQSETPITISPVNATVMFASANTFQGGNFSTGSYASSNGGYYWVGNDTLGGNIFNYGDPAPVIDHYGRFIISFIHAPTLKMGASYSLNKGLTWSAPTIIPTASTSTDKNMSVTDLSPASIYYGRTYVVYTEFNGPYTNRIVISYTLNGGATWSAATPVSPPPLPGYYNLGADVAVDSAGTVYVVWGNNIINGQNSTEDYMGFAKSTNGGSTWPVSTNTAVDMNGLRTSNLFNGIRCNGFPRIDVDKSQCGPRSGWIYVVTGEKYFYPANGVADVVLSVSVDQGLTWARYKVNQNFDPDNFEYLPAVRVDETGDVNVCYYSTRNSPGNTEADVYLSRSTDGGITFSDIKVSDHNFTPAPIPGTASGYQGDYIGITSGNGRVWPYWCDNSISGRYQAWTASVDITGKVNCPVTTPETGGADFFAIFKFYFPHRYWRGNTAYFRAPRSGIADDMYWFRSSASAYGIDTGSAVFMSYTAPFGITQSMSTFEFPPITQPMFITFDEAYAPNTNTELGPDSLLVEFSFDAGLTFNLAGALYGSFYGGSLNTAPPTSASFIPTPSQWASKMFPVPSLTNMIRLTGVSGNSNNIYVDNLNLQVLDPPVAGNVKVIPEAYYNPGLNNLYTSDMVKVYLMQSVSPYPTVDSAIAVIDPFTFNAPVVFPNALSGNYYVKVVHRNCIETWSKAGGESYVRGQVFNYDFTADQTTAYGNNLKQINSLPLTYGIYSGDVNVNGVIDLNDVILVYNDVINFTAGYVQTDLNGDLITSLDDLVTVYNNSLVFAHTIVP